MATLVDICNAALSEIAAGPIGATTEASIEAREANRFVPALLAELTLWSDWSWAIRRAALTEVTNDRPAEWLHAYAVPGDCARPLAVRMVQDPATILPMGGPYSFPVQDAIPLAMLHEGGLIYCNLASATLVYVAQQSDAAALPPLVQRAFVLELAARIAVPIRKDASLARALGGAAEMARARAIAEDRNQRAERPTHFVSDAAFARAGVGEAL